MIAIVGSGRIGSTIALNLVARELDDILLLDIVKGLPQGEALDLGHMATRYGSDVDIKGSNDYEEMRGSNLAILAAGLSRRPGMTRLDLLQKNYEVVKQVSEKVALYAPDSKVLVVTNPLDVMTYVALKVTGFEPNRVFGMGGMLDASRLGFLISRALGVSRSSVQALVIGEHGESMIPLPRYSSVSGIPVTELLSEEQAKGVVEGTRRVAAEVIALKGSSFYAPALAVADMVEAVVKDGKRVFPLSAYLRGEYGVEGICIGVPAILGKDGVERVIELKLTPKEGGLFMKSVEMVRAAISELGL